MKKPALSLLLSSMLLFPVLSTASGPGDFSLA